MISRRRFKDERLSGMIVLDILIALALAAVLVSGMTGISLEAREIFDRAAARSVLLDAYEEHAADFAGLLPHGSLTRSYQIGSTSPDTIEIKAEAGWYANDRVETDITASHEGRSVAFEAVKAYPFASINDSAGTPLCSSDFNSTAPVGSYEFSRLRIDQSERQNRSLLTASTSLTISPIILPIDPLLPLTDLEVRDGTAYISIDSNRSSDPDLLIVDINDPKHPRSLSSLNTGPGISAIAIAGRYVFAAAASTAAELHVIRLDSLASPVLVKRYKLPPPQASTTMPMGSAIFYDKGSVYLGMEKWDGQELSVIDVVNPEEPVTIGGFETGSKINDISVRGGIAYIAASDQSQLRMLDVRNPADPSLISSFSPSGWQRQEGKSVASFEDSLGFGRTSGGFDITTDHELFSLASSSDPALSAPLSMNIPGGVYGIVVDRSRIYIATRAVDREFAIFDRALGTTTASYYPLPVAPQAMACDQDRIYILAATAPVIYEITFNRQN